MSQKNIVPTITVKRIKEQSFFINEFALGDATQVIKIEIGQNLSFAIDANLVNLTVRIYYHFLEEEDNILVDISVQNLFEVPNLINFQISPTTIKLPIVTITNIVGLSISHTRAILATKLLGTPLQESLPVIVDPEDVARHFFPTMFDIDHPEEHAEEARLMK